MKKIEVIKQHDLRDCGPCALQSIIKYYDGYVPIEKIREDTCVNEKGTTAYHLIRAATSYGFDALGVKVESIFNENIYLPAICHLTLENGLQHFAVVYQITDKYVGLMDPAKGKIKMSIEEFNSKWDNVLILLNPINQIVVLNKEVTIWMVFKNLLLKNKKLFGIISLINIVFMILVIISNFYFQVAVSSINLGSDLGLLKFIIVLFLILGIIKVLISFFKNYYLNFFNRNLDTEIFTDFLQHIFKLPLKFIQNRTTGEVISRVQELSEIKSMLAEFLTNVILNSILIIGSIIVLYFINAKLFFLLCLIISIYIIVGLIFNKVIYEQVNECIISATEFNETLVEHVEMIESIKHMNLTKKFLYELNSKLIKMFKRDFKFQSLLNVIDFLKNFIYEIGLFLITTFGVYLIYKGDLQLLSLVTFNSIIIYLFNPVKDLIDLIPKYNYLKASFNKISEFLNIPEEEEGVGLKNINDTTIEALDVGYSYNKITNILEHVNFKINPQDKVFLKGPSGSGKSTICNLIIENQLENMGIIMIGDACKQDYDIEALRSNILYVGQNEKLFTGTIRDNIVCFRDVLDEDFKKVIKICKLEEVINKRPNRFNFMLNAALNNLSGGERQRIILARGLLKDAKIIILDEALSEVNFEMEKEIINNIKEHFKDKTLIYVSHKKVDNLFNKVIDLGEAYG